MVLSHLPGLERSGDFKTTLTGLVLEPEKVPVTCLPLVCTVLCQNVSHQSQGLALPLALRLPTLRPGKECPGRSPAAADGHTEAGMSGSGVCRMPAQGRKAAWLPSSLGQPRSLSCLAPCLGSRNPGSRSWFAPRHSGDAGSGLRLPWEPRPGPGLAHDSGLRAGAVARTTAFGVSQNDTCP